MKTLIAPLALAAGLTAPVAAAAPLYSDVVLSDDPIAYYRLSETSGTVASDSANSNDAVVSGSVDLTATGPAGDGFGLSNSAAGFDGSDNAVINAGTGLTAGLAGNAAVTVEFWIGDDYDTTANTNLVPLFVGLETNAGGTTTGINATIRNNSFRFGARSDGGDGFKSGSFLALGGYETDFIHAVGVIDFEGNTLTTYLNGTEAAVYRDLNFGSDTFTPGARDAFLGGLSATNTYDGTLDEFSFYGRALSEAEVAERYAARVPEPGSLALLSAGVVCLAARRRSAR